MDYHEKIDPNIKTKIAAAQSYCVEGSLFNVPFVHGDSTDRSCELTLLKTQEKFFDEFRQLPQTFYPIFDEKNAASLALNPPVKPNGLDMRMYFQESSSQHMATILEGIDAAGVTLSGAHLLVTSETLNRIAGTVFDERNSWRLRASIEYVAGRSIIVLCDDDQDGMTPPTPGLQFIKERTEAAVLAQSICERNTERPTNKLLHGAHAVMASISDGEEKIRMVVLGEVDMIVERQPISAFVSTGIGRSNRMSLGSNKVDLNTCNDYLWSRSFWLGIGCSLIGLRPSDDADVQFVQRFSLTNFFRQHRLRNNKIADTATHCVARVLLGLRRAVLTEPRSNWLIEYEGNTQEPGFIKIRKAEESWSFLLVREKYHMIKTEFIQVKQEQISHLLKRKHYEKTKGSPLVKLVPKKKKNSSNPPKTKKLRKSSRKVPLQMPTTPSKEDSSPVQVPDEDGRTMISESRKQSEKNIISFIPDKKKEEEPLTPEPSEMKEEYEVSISEVTSFIQIENPLLHCELVPESIREEEVPMEVPKEEPFIEHSLPDCEKTQEFEDPCEIPVQENFKSLDVLPFPQSFMRITAEINVPTTILESMELVEKSAHQNVLVETVNQNENKDLEKVKVENSPRPDPFSNRSSSKEVVKLSRSFDIVYIPFKVSLFSIIKGNIGDSKNDIVHPELTTNALHWTPERQKQEKQQNRKNRTENCCCSDFQLPKHEEIAEIPLKDVIPISRLSQLEIDCSTKRQNLPKYGPELPESMKSKAKKSDSKSKTDEEKSLKKEEKRKKKEEKEKVKLQEKMKKKEEKKKKKEEKSRRKMEEGSKSPHSPLREIQNSQKPLTNFIARKNEYQTIRGDVDRKVYRYHPYQRRSSSRRLASPSQIPVSVRTVSYDSRKRTESIIYRSNSFREDLRKVRDDVINRRSSRR